MQVEDETKPEAGPPEEQPAPRLAASLARLPREIQPARDLWPGIAERLGTAPPALQPSPASPSWWKLAAATLAGAALGTLLTGLVLGGSARQEMREGGVPPSAVLPVGLAEGAVVPDYRLVEADFLRAREALWLEVYTRRDHFSPDTLATVDKSFASLDRAIQDLRKALEREPGNPRLEAELYRSHRRSLGLLRKLADET